MPTITISADALRLVLPHLSSEESRPTLGTLLVESSGAIVATNGHTLAAHDQAASNVPRDMTVRFHKPREAMARKVDRVEIDTDGSPTAHGIAARLFDRVGKLIGATLCDITDDRFPDWRAVVPSGDPTPCAFLGLKIEDVGERFAAWGPLHCAFTGPTSPVMVCPDNHPDLFGLWMPVRLPDTAFRVPAFAERRPARAEAAA